MPSEPRLQDPFDKLTDVFYRTDVDGTIQVISPSVERYGHRVAALIGRNVTELYRDPGARDRLLAALMIGGALEDYELELKRADGEAVPVSASARLVVDDAGRAVGLEGVLRDITVRKRQEAALRQEIADRRTAEAQLSESRARLRALSRRLLSVAEDERGRIAREIHDELGQMLSALTLDLGWLGSKLTAEGSPLADKVRRMSGLVDDMIERVQTIATNLRPAMLDDIGLSATLRWLCSQHAEHGSLDVRLDMNDDDLELDADRAITIFRLVQEALTNVARHAQATRVEIAVARAQDRVRLEVRDDGRGIRADEIANPTSLGLIGMRERVDRFGGSLEIEGAPGRGTLLKIEIPTAVTKEYSLR